MRHRRQGVTLIEVLTAIFIAGIGLLALLTLFPLGAMNMAQSIRDDRVGHIKENAVAIALMHEIHKDPMVTPALTNPGGGLPALAPGTLGGSYPVLVDPMGHDANVSSPAFQSWVAGENNTPPAIPPRGVRRSGVLFLTVNPSNPDPLLRVPNRPHQVRQLARWCSLLDDLDFETEGVDAGTPRRPGGIFERTPNYTWGWLIRQERVGVVNTTEIQAVIYHRRPLLPNVGETAYDATADPSANSFTITWTAAQDRPNVKIGGWILDTTMTPRPRGYFYRVVGRTDLTANSILVEVQQTPRGLGPGPNPACRIVVMDDVVEVTPPYRP